MNQKQINIIYLIVIILTIFTIIYINNSDEPTQIKQPEIKQNEVLKESLPTSYKTIITGTNGTWEYKYDANTNITISRRIS